MECKLNLSNSNTFSEIWHSVKILNENQNYLKQMDKYIDLLTLSDQVILL